MTSSAFADRSGADQYLAQAIAQRARVDPQELANLPGRELDRLLPGARASFEHREAFAARILSRRGVDESSAEYQAARTQAREILDRVDNSGADHAA